MDKLTSCKAYRTWMNAYIDTALVGTPGDEPLTLYICCWPNHRVFFASTDPQAAVYAFHKPEYEFKC